MFVNEFNLLLIYLGTDLVAALASLNVYDFTHFGFGLMTFRRLEISYFGALGLALA